MPAFQVLAGQGRKTHPTRKATVHRRHYRRRYRRYTHVRMKRERVKQIQQALVKVGFLHEAPDGIWGPSTRAAMRQYQKANGFTPTGLPEAKPLMKLGLGPHPLPPGLDPMRSAEAESRGQTEASTSPSSPVAKNPSTSNP